MVVAKVWAVMFFMIWTRGTLVRIRYDHFMKLGWKVLIPISLVWFVLVAVVRAFRTFSGASVQALLLPMAVVFCVIMFILFLIPDKEEEEELYEDYEDDDEEDADDEDVEILDAEDDHVAFLEGFPVPPPPGTSLPPSPRARRAALAAQGDRRGPVTPRPGRPPPSASWRTPTSRTTTRPVPQTPPSPPTRQVWPARQLRPVRTQPPPCPPSPLTSRPTRPAARTQTRPLRHPRREKMTDRPHRSRGSPAR